MQGIDGFVSYELFVFMYVLNLLHCLFAASAFALFGVFRLGFGVGLDSILCLAGCCWVWGIWATFVVFGCLVVW